MTDNLREVAALRYNSPRPDSGRRLLGRGPPLLSLLLVCLTALLAFTGGCRADPYRAPRTAYGVPDLQGEWSNLSLTKLERPSAFNGLIVKDADAKAYIARRNARLSGIATASSPGPPAGQDVGEATTEFPDRDVDFMRIAGERRSSILVDPADGRLAFTPAGAQQAAAALEADEHDFSGPEARLPNERCLLAPEGAEGPPIIGEPQNANYQIVQTRGEVAILSEMIHDVRIVRIGAKHPTAATHPWMGDSIGWWDGDTLVVETVDQNIGGARRLVGPGVFYVSPAAKVIERFTRISPTQLRYDFTVEDPAIYTQTLRGEAVMTTTQAPIYEYACHEGNYALANILAGARKAERDAAGHGLTESKSAGR
jgi:hypothetical protein